MICALHDKPLSVVHNFLTASVHGNCLWHVLCSLHYVRNRCYLTIIVLSVILAAIQLVHVRTVLPAVRSFKFDAHFPNVDLIVMQSRIDAELMTMTKSTCTHARSLMWFKMYPCTWSGYVRLTKVSWVLIRQAGRTELKRCCNGLDHGRRPQMT
jgi:hypothetical protein